MAIMCDIQNEAYPVRTCEEETKAQEPGNSGEQAPPPGLEGKGEKESNNKTEKNMNGSEDSAEDHAGLVAVEHGPTDEVWVGIVTKRAGDDRGRDGECRGVSRVLESVELEVFSSWLTVMRKCEEAYAGCTIFVREIQLSGSARCEVVGNYPIDL